MSQFPAVVMHGTYGGEGRYTFAGPDDLLSKSPNRVMRALMESDQVRDGLGFVDYGVNAAMKNKDLGVVTVIGELTIKKHGHQPFMCMISAGEG